MGRDGPRGPHDPRPSRRSRRSAAVRSRRDRRSRPTTRSSTGCARDAETALHPSCTCRIGIDDDSVLDPDDDRACTASTGCASSTPSSMRYVTNGNIYAPVMMLAEKASDAILGNTPLPPEPVEYFRHDPGRGRCVMHGAWVCTSVARWSRPRRARRSPRSTRPRARSLAEVAHASDADVDRAVAAARDGFAVWSAMSGAERSRVLLRAAAILRARNDELARLEVQDTGKPIAEATEVDVVSRRRLPRVLRRGRGHAARRVPRTSAARSPTRGVSRSACAPGSVRGTTRSRSRAGSRRPRSPAATRWCSSPRS